MTQDRETIDDLIQTISSQSEKRNIIGFEQIKENLDVLKKYFHMLTEEDIVKVKRKISYQLKPLDDMRKKLKPQETKKGKIEQNKVIEDLLNTQEDEISIEEKDRIRYHQLKRLSGLYSTLRSYRGTLRNIHAESKTGEERIGLKLSAANDYKIAADEIKFKSFMKQAFFRRLFASNIYKEIILESKEELNKKKLFSQQVEAAYNNQALLSIIYFRLSKTNIRNEQLKFEDMIIELTKDLIKYHKNVAEEVKEKEQMVDKLRKKQTKTYYAEFDKLGKMKKKYSELKPNLGKFTNRILTYFNENETMMDLDFKTENYFKSNTLDENNNHPTY